MGIRRLATIVAACVVAVSCSSSSGDAAVDTSESTSSTESTTTVPAPILALVGNLELAEGQCYADLPPPTAQVPDPTTTTVEGETAVATEPTVPPTVAAPTTTPRPTIVAMVDCAENNDGTVYAAFCLGPHAEFADDLTAAACPGDPTIEYPGDRTIRRAASRICLQRFTERFEEDYATSERIATEFVPTEGLWGLDDRRVVCLVEEPAP
ncbi:MAG: hypothetical protein R2733_03415 [Acidimicrobiales bacterium]